MTRLPVYRLRHTSGVTLIELLVTLSVLAILTALAAPNIGFFVVKNTASTIATDFARDIGRARTEAIARNQCTTVCMMTVNKSGQYVCATSGSDWNLGWMIFENAEGCTASSPQPKSSGSVISVRETGNPKFTLKPNTTRRFITFNSRGMTSVSTAARNFTLAYTPESVSSPHYRSLCLSSTGRVTIQKYEGTSACK